MPGVSVRTNTENQWKFRLIPPAVPKRRPGHGVGSTAAEDQAIVRALSRASAADAILTPILEHLQKYFLNSLSNSSFGVSFI